SLLRSQPWVLVDVAFSWAHILVGEPVATSPGYALTRGVRVGHAEPRENASLAPLHRFGLPVRFVIVAQKVEKAMQRQMGDVMIEPLALGARLARDGLVGEHDVAEVARRPAGGCRRRKRQHVGRLVAAAPAAVEGADRAVAGEDDGEL